MTRLARIIPAALAACALAGCGTAATTPVPAATAKTTPAATVAALTCKQQGDRWKTANKAVIRRFDRSLKPFSAGTVTSAQARALSSASQAMIAAPLPSCADPKGYYAQAMANLVTAGDAASGGGALAELGALGPMENAATLLTELSAEMKQTIGSGKI